jgi:hypothetical protein
LSAAVAEGDEQTLLLALAMAREADVSLISLQEAEQRLRALKAARGVEYKPGQDDRVRESSSTTDAEDAERHPEAFDYKGLDRFKGYASKIKTGLKNITVDRASVSGALGHASVSGAKLASRVKANISRFKRGGAGDCSGTGESCSADDPNNKLDEGPPLERGADDMTAQTQPHSNAGELMEPSKLADSSTSHQRSSAYDWQPTPTAICPCPRSNVYNAANISASQCLSNVYDSIETQSGSRSLTKPIEESLAPLPSALKDSDLTATTATSGDRSKFDGCHWHISPDDDAEAERPPLARSSQSGLADPRWVAQELGEHEQHSLPLPRSAGGASGGGVPGASKFEHQGWAIKEDRDCHGPPMIPRTSFYRSSPGVQGASLSGQPPSPSGSACSCVSALGEKAADDLVSKLIKSKRDARRDEKNREAAQRAALA